MNFRQRLLRYLIGIGIGCLLVFVIFPKMDWLGWTPGKQMNKRIRQATWVASDYGVCTMKSDPSSRYNDYSDRSSTENRPASNL
jgi:hypothetical protein